MAEAAKVRIQRALETLVSSPHRESSLLVDCGEVYLMFFTSQEDANMRMEAVTSDFLPAPLKLSAGRANELRKLGFDRTGRNRNWTRELALEKSSIPNLAAESADILRRIYGIDTEPNIELRRENHERPDNDDLVVAMRELSRDDSAAARHRLYTELVNAHFLMPLAEGAPSQGEETLPEEFHVYRVDDGFPIFAVFTDWSSLRFWRPRGTDYGVVHGSELFTALLERDAAGLEINPAGNIGGHLYRHEVELLAEAVAHHRRTRMN